MNIFVTGATGFLGKALVLRLLKMGYNVSGLGRNEKIGKQLEEQGMCFICGDLADEEVVVSACENMDYVFHCGALSSPWGKYEDFYNTNVLGTKHVIKGCMEHKIKRLIHVSTPSIYFHYENKVNVKESDLLPEKFANNYAKTKHLAEQLVDEAYVNGLPVITIRPRAIFGPGDNAILPRLIKTNEEKFIPIINEGKSLLDLTYVENVVDALLICMTSKENTLGQKYNITNGEQVPFIEVLTKAFQELNLTLNTKKVPYRLLFSLASFLEWFSIRFQKGKEPFLTKYTVSLLSNTQTLSIDKAKKELGYTPNITIEEGIRLYAKWYHANQS